MQDALDLIDLSGEAMILLDETNKIVAWNSAMQNLSEINSDDTLSKDFFEIFPELEKSAVKKVLKARIFQKEPINHSLSFKKIESYSISISPISKKGNQNVLLIFHRIVNKEDFTDKYKPLIAESPIATAIYSLEGKAKYFNRAYAKLWGAKEEIDIKNLSDYNVLEDDQIMSLGVMPYIRRAFNGETTELPPISYDPKNTTALSHIKAGDVKHVKGHIFPVKNDKQEIKEVAIVLSDVTFQKQAEQILTDTHLKFQMLTMSLPGVIYEYHENGKNNNSYTYISQGCQEMFGFTPEEIIETPGLIESVIHEQDLQGFEQSINQSRKAVEYWQWEGRIVVEEEVRWVEGKSRPIKLQNGNIVRYGMLLDITDKKKAEEQYELAEERLKMALDGAELGLWEWDLGQFKTIFNKSWAAKFGYSHDELKQEYKQWKNLIHPEDIDLVMSRLLDHLEGRTDNFQCEYRFLAKNGKWHWILSKGKAAERDEKGVIKKLSGIYLDINEEKKVAKAVKHNQQLFKLLFESSPLGIVLLDLNYNVTQLNKGFENIFGYSDNEIIGKKLNDIIIPDQYQQEALDINIFTTGGKVSVFESQRRHKTGHLIPVIIYGVPVTLEGKSIGIYGIYVDITDRKQAEKELQIRNGELDNFVYKVSHDLRAPLSSILGLINLAKHDQNEDDIREYVRLIEQRVQQLDNFISDVLSHSKNLKLEVSSDEINISKVIDKCFSDLSYLNGAEKIEKIVTISHESFYCDKWRVNEIFRNLISNAIKYHNPDEENPYIKIDVEIINDRVKIRFRDNGIGIDQEIIPKVFDMFYRATEYSEGSGIGLYIVKNAVDKLAGKVSVHSEINVGTSFEIILPIMVPSAQLLNH